MGSLLISSLVLAFAAILITHRCLQNRRPSSSHPLPPGPPRLPFIGNVAVINSNTPWVTYAEWAKKYGDLVYARLLGQDIIIINSEAVAKELLETRSSNYSDRPYLATRDLCGRNFSSIFLEYGDTWRLHRRFFHQTFRREAVARFSALQHRKVCQLLRRFLHRPSQFSDHIFEYTGSAILGSVYNYDAKSRKDELFIMITETLKVTTRALRPDVSILVGAFPALLKLPSWLPGMSFKQEMAIAKSHSKKYVETPFQHALQRMSTDDYVPSMVSDALRTVEENGTTVGATWMKDLSEAAATAFIAGSETSNSVILLFLLLMAINPEVQKKAQAEIDAVVGKGRLPTIEDRPSLPYIDAILREAFRFGSIVPLSVPHAVVDDDIYAGYHIPKGAIVVTNLWSMSHNESKYPNPHQFIPERFLDSDGSLTSDDVEHVTFGFGRRICVGRYFAETSVWSAIANILFVFMVEKARDATGAEVPIELRFTSGITIHPLPFQCRIVPRMQEMDAEQLELLVEASAA